MKDYDNQEHQQISTPPSVMSLILQTINNPHIQRFRWNWFDKS